MSEEDPDFLRLIVCLEHFMFFPSHKTFVPARVAFKEFVDKHWATRHHYIGFQRLYCEQMDKHFNLPTVRKYQVHMSCLLDGDFSPVDPSVWRITQFFHASTIFPLPLDGSPMSAPFEHMTIVPPAQIQRELHPFSHVGRTHEQMALSYVRSYALFLQSHVTRRFVRSLFEAVKEEGESMVPFIGFLQAALLRALIAIADPSSPRHKAVRRFSQSLLVELFYEDILRNMFNADVDSLCNHSPDAQGPEGPGEVAEARGAVRTLWETTNTPKLVEKLATVHLAIWGPYYVNLLRDI